MKWPGYDSYGGNVRSCTYTSSMSGTNARKIDWFEFGIRFACGALLGLLVSIRLVLYWYDENPAILVLVGVGVILLCGFAAARYGDKFWYSLFLR
jgi:Mg/Co/Ni transporter MgtE